MAPITTTTTPPTIKEDCKPYWRKNIKNRIASLTIFMQTVINLSDWHAVNNIATEIASLSKELHVDEYNQMLEALP